jgi:hypothetical protein
VETPEDFAAPLLHLFHEQFWSLDNTFLLPFIPENKKDKDYDLSVAPVCTFTHQVVLVHRKVGQYQKSQSFMWRVRLLDYVNKLVGLHARSTIFEPAKLP